MTENLQPRCHRCRHWQKVADREHGNCDAVNVDHYTLPDDFCRAYTPHLLTKDHRDGQRATS